MNKFIKNCGTYSEFVDHIERFTKGLLVDGVQEVNGCSSGEIEVLLNGANARAVSLLIDGQFRKENGIFFTSESLADKVAAKISVELSSGAKVLDPTCGSGDLLLACTKLLPLRKSLSKTLHYWSSLLFGLDIYDDFVRSAQLRLILSAIDKVSPVRVSVLSEDAFRNLYVGDFLEDSNVVKKVDCIIANPPFGQVELTGLVEWGSGKGQLAALFLDRIIQRARTGQRVIAILPDVLRSGTRYKKWRRFINSNATKLNIDICGKFNAEADVDVFILDFSVDKTRVENSSCESFYESDNLEVSKVTVADHFKVSVGPVVPHRQREGSEMIPYIDTGNSPLWEEVIPNKEHNYFCTLKKPPFVVVRRTSGPNDSPRAKATIIRGNKKVAVENHLLVLEPLDGTLKMCRKFMRMVKSDASSRILNRNIRCRHLTVGSISNLPWNLD